MRRLRVAVVAAVAAAALPLHACRPARRERTPAAHPRTATCPADSPSARRAVYRFLTHPDLASVRSDVGVTTTDTSSVRLLSDATDLAVCRKFVREITLPADAPREWAFYEAGGFYFVATAIIQDGRLRLRFSPLIVFDRALAARQVIGM